MNKTIGVVSSNKAECDALLSLLAEWDFAFSYFEHLNGLKSLLQKTPDTVAILDVDSIALTNRSIRNLMLEFPTTTILCTSKERFHPKLQDAISNYIYACLIKPIDPDELFYWLKTLCDNEEDTRSPPE